MSENALRVAIVIGSQRTRRVGPQVACYVESIIAPQASQASPAITLHHVDVAALDLPLFDEPDIPQRIHNAEDYAHRHTQRWSRTISSFDGFVFISPQYNWGIPAGLKNAIDYLFNEWTGKAAMVVTYGGHGGDKCDAALRTVLQGGIKMSVVQAKVNMAFQGKEMMGHAFAGEDIRLDADEGGVWSQYRGDVQTAWTELVQLLAGHNKD